MTDHPADDLDLRSSSVEQITKRMRQGVRQALYEHKQAGRSVIVWDREKDRIETLSAAEIESFEAAGDRAPSIDVAEIPNQLHLGDGSTPATDDLLSE